MQFPGNFGRQRINTVQQKSRQWSDIYLNSLTKRDRAEKSNFTDLMDELNTAYKEIKQKTNRIYILEADVEKLSRAVAEHRQLLEEQK